ncbi:MAG TPA: DNA repair protein RecO [Pseudomonadales bacterium]
MQTQDLAFVLHSRPYRETSAILQCYSRQHGRIDGVLRGVYQQGRKGQQLRAAVQTGNQLELEWRGREGLKTMVRCELLAAARCATVRHLACLAYVNELMLHFLPAGQPAPALFHDYSYLVQAMAIDRSPERVLRLYEFALLDELGCVPDFSWDSSRNAPLQAGRCYSIDPQRGVVDGAGDSLCLDAADLEALAQRELASARSLQIAKRVNRRLIDFQLAGRELKARALYRQLQQV